MKTDYSAWLFLLFFFILFFPNTPLDKCLSQPSRHELSSFLTFLSTREYKENDPWHDSLFNSADFYNFACDALPEAGIEKIEKYQKLANTLQTSLFWKSARERLEAEKCWQVSQACEQEYKNYSSVVARRRIIWMLFFFLYGWFVGDSYEAYSLRCESMPQMIVRTTMLCILGIIHIKLFPAMWFGEHSPYLLESMAINRFLANMLKTYEKMGCHPSTSFTDVLKYMVQKNSQPVLQKEKKAWAGLFKNTCKLCVKEREPKLPFYFLYLT